MPLIYYFSKFSQCNFLGMEEEIGGKSVFLCEHTHLTN